MGCLPAIRSSKAVCRSGSSVLYVATVLLCVTGSFACRSQPIRTQCTGVTLMKGECPLAPSQSSELVLCGMCFWSPCRSVLSVRCLYFHTVKNFYSTLFYSLLQLP